METLIGLLVTLLIVGLIFYVVWWIIGMIPLPEPVKQIVSVIVAIIFLLILLRYLMGYIPPSHALWSTMCLGWKTKANCKARPAVNVTQPSGNTCPDITWFYLALAAIGIGTVVKGGK
jgi:hypothetical protein